MPQITELNIYPVKSCRGISVRSVSIEAAGFEHDREWMVVRPDGRFVTQRDIPRLALIVPALKPEFLVLTAPQRGELHVPLRHKGATVTTQVWGRTCPAIDAGEQAADWFSRFLETPVRLVRFDPSHRRLSDLEWTAGLEAENRFSDGYPILLISEASLVDLNGRLPSPLPMNRFRPNLVLNGLRAYEEDAVHELRDGPVRLRAVKPCTRCKITTTDQETAEITGSEPLRTLMTYRASRKPQGVLFGQNLVIVSGVGSELHVGMTLQVSYKNDQRVDGG